MTARAVLLIGLVLATVSSGSCCKISSPESMSRCVKELLESGRDSLRSQFDPLSLQDQHGLGKLEWWLTNVTIRGLGNYSIEHLGIVDADRSALRVEFNVSWPSLVGSARGRLRYCKTFLGKEHCFKLSGEPRMSVTDPAGRLETVLDLSLKNDGQLQVTPRDTDITMNLSHISVEMGLNGILGMLDRFLGFPSKIYVSKLINVWWKKEKKLVENMAKSQIHDLIYQYVSPRLGQLLKGFTG